ncbi:MAG: hypothetical protein ACM3SV_15125 [Betaproteobacteria bacterium]
MTEPFAFPPHGRSDIWTEDRVLVVHTQGPWNRELVQEAAKVVLAKAEVFEGRPWLLLGIIYGDGLHTPEAFQEMIQAIRDQQAAGRSGTALILADVGNSSFFRGIYAKMYSAAAEPLEFFADEASARAWIAERLTHLS